MCLDYAYLAFLAVEHQLDAEFIGTTAKAIEPELYIVAEIDGESHGFRSVAALKLIYDRFFKLVLPCFP